MQMGRWFGYRQGYEELPRVWMTRDMRDAFKELATVEAEIRGDIDVFREQDISPLDFAVRIRHSPLQRCRRTVTPQDMVELQATGVSRR